MRWEGVDSPFGAYICVCVRERMIYSLLCSAGEVSFPICSPPLCTPLKITHPCVN